jgi:small-conductance mechanosensitive channel
MKGYGYQHPENLGDCELTGFREVIRDRILYFIGFFALLMAFAWRLLPEIAVGTHQKIFLDLGLAAIGLLGVIVAVFVGYRAN